ncbi:DUF6907 domain-containing protein [Streptomyces xanthophaeus]|uniref:DUF6907 domain-containing protein n=1 Tax=Streptomyces xanthophaeus TaxID=67385 RepID=UPI0036737FE3
MPTIDAGPVTLPEPSWCVGHANERLGYRVDIHHSAPLPVPDGLVDLHAELVAYPCGTVPVPTSVHIELIGPSATLDPAGLREFATALVTRAALLRDLADRLTALRAEGAS